MSKIVISQAKRARGVCPGMNLINTPQKNKALRSMASSLIVATNSILKANFKDVQIARANGLGAAMIARLTLDKKKIVQMAESLRQIATLHDPVGQVLSSVKRPNGLRIEKVRVPIGVILIIFESRPNVVADCMALCLKSSNAVILKGGKEARFSNDAIFDVLSKAAYKHGIPRGAFTLVDSVDRSAVDVLLKQDQWIDLVIPRGGEGLIRHVAENSRIPVIKHYKGVCHVFVDATAALQKAQAIVINAKTQNPAVCNAMETLLVHQKVAPTFLPRIAKALSEHKVKLIGDVATRKYIPSAIAARESDWSTEYLDKILSIRVVGSVDEAIAHIEKYGSRHSDAIITKSNVNAKRFCDLVDSSCVFVNASTRFNDGGQFGMGAEMGISTDKIHARGPMGLVELTTYKYIVRGDGHIRV